MPEVPHILFHRSTPWHSAVECSTKTYAKRFRAAGYPVTYVQDLANLGHIVTRKGYYDTWKRGSRWEDDIWVATACSLCPRVKGPGRLMDWSLAASYRWSVPSIRAVVGRAGRRGPDVIWTTAPGSSALKESFPEAKLIFHVVDYYPAFRGEEIKRVERRDYAAADCVFSIGRALSAYLHEDLGVPMEKIVTLGQGAPLEKYSQRLDPPADLAPIPGPIAICVGVLDKLDLELLGSAATVMAAAGGSVVLIGPGSAGVKAMTGTHRNLHLLGPRPATEVPAYLQNADIGLMLYDRGTSEVYRGQNPLKLYQYAAAGLAVVSTPHDEYDFLQPPIRVVASPELVEAAIAGILGERDGADEAMTAFAEAHSWAKCEQSAAGAISQLLLGVRA